MIKFGEVCSFVEAVTIMRNKQRELTLHKSYNNIVDVKFWEAKVDEKLKTLQKNIEGVKREKKKNSQPSFEMG